MGARCPQPVKMDKPAGPPRSQPRATWRAGSRSARLQEYQCRLRVTPTTVAYGGGAPEPPRPRHQWRRGCRPRRRGGNRKACSGLLASKETSCRPTATETPSAMLTEAPRGKGPESRDRAKHDGRVRGWPHRRSRPGQCQGSPSENSGDRIGCVEERLPGGRCAHPADSAGQRESQKVLAPNRIPPDALEERPAGQEHRARDRRSQRYRWNMGPAPHDRSDGHPPCIERRHARRSGDGEPP